MTRENYRLGINLGVNPDYIEDLTRTVLDIEGLLASSGYRLKLDNLEDFTSFKILDFDNEPSFSTPYFIRLIHRSAMVGEDADYSLQFERKTYGGVLGEFSSPTHIMMDFKMIPSNHKKAIVKGIEDLVGIPNDEHPPADRIIYIP